MLPGIAERWEKDADYSAFFSVQEGTFAGLFFDKSEDLYAKNSLIYFVMQVRAYNSVQNADVVPVSAWKGSMDVALTSSTVDLSLIEMTGAVVTVPYAYATPIFGSASKIVQGVPAKDLFKKKDNVQNRYDFKIMYQNSADANGYNLLTPGALAINIQEGKATDGVAAYTDYYVGFAGLTRNEITAKGSVVASVNYDNSSEEFSKPTTPDDLGLGGYLKVTKGDRTYMIVKVAADNWAPKTNYIPSYANPTVKQMGYAVFVKVTASGMYNYICQLDTEVTALEGYGQSLGIAVNPDAQAKSGISGYLPEDIVPGFNNMHSDYPKGLLKVLPYTFMRWNTPVLILFVNILFVSFCRQIPFCMILPYYGITLIIERWFCYA